MQENYTFTALLTINLGGIGLLTTYLFAIYFFYSERFNDLKIKIDSNLSSLSSNFTPTKEKNESRAPIESFEALKSSQEIAYNSLNQILSYKIENQKAINLVIEAENRKGRLTNYIPNSDAIIHKKHFSSLQEDLFIKFNEYLRSIDIVFDEYNNFIHSANSKSTDFNLSDKNDALKSIRKKIEFIDNSLHGKNNNNFTFDSIAMILEHKQKTTISKNKLRYTKRRTEIKENIIDDLIESIIKYKKLSIQNSENNNFNKIYYSILISGIFGVLFPLACISTVPYKTYLPITHFDVSILVAALLSFLSLLPYAIILSKLPTILNEKRDKHPTHI